MDGIHYHNEFNFSSLYLIEFLPFNKQRWCQIKNNHVTFNVYVITILEKKERNRDWNKKKKKSQYKNIFINDNNI